MSKKNAKTPLHYVLDYLKSSCPKTPNIFTNLCMQFIKTNTKTNQDENMEKFLKFLKSVCETCKAKKVVKGHVCECECHYVLIGSKDSNLSDHETDEETNEEHKHLGDRQPVKDAATPHTGDTADKSTMDISSFLINDQSSSESMMKELLIQDRPCTSKLLSEFAREQAKSMERCNQSDSSRHKKRLPTVKVEPFTEDSDDDSSDDLFSNELSTESLLDSSDDED